MEAFIVKANYQGNDGCQFDVEMNILADTKENAEDFFNKHLTIAPAFGGEWWEDEEIKSNTKIISIDEFSDDYFKDIELYYSIPLIGGEYYTDGYGQWNEIKNKIIDRLDGDFNKIVKIYLSDDSSKETILFFMKNPAYNQRTSDAIRRCINGGINPFGS